MPLPRQLISPYSLSVPLIYAGAAIIAGLMVPRVEAGLLPHLLARMNAEAAMAMFSSIASGMMALTGIVFSLAFVMVQFSATAYSPRLVQWIVQDPIFNHSIGMFTATFLYALAALASVGTNPKGGTPLISAWLVIALLIGSIVMLVRLVDRVAMLQIARVLRMIGDAGREVIEHTYRPLSEIHETATTALKDIYEVSNPQVLAYQGTPLFVQSIDREGLLRIADRAGGVVILNAAVGDIVVDGTPLVNAYAFVMPLPFDELRRCMRLGLERTFAQDPKYPIRLLVDTAIKALSPAINDPTTAVQALDQIEDLLRRLSRRDLDIGRIYDTSGQPKVQIPVPSWDDFLMLGCEEIRFYGATSIQVMRRMRALLEDLERYAPDDKRPVVRKYLERVNATVARSFADSAERIEALERDRQGLGLSRDRKVA